MPHTVTPTFRTLDRSECDTLLARNHVGRLAYALHHRVDIEPIHYVLADDVCYMRTAPGSKLATLAHAPWVAFEVDEIDGPFDWRSVVAHGTIYVLHDEGTPAARASYAAAVRHLRALIPGTLAPDDPVPTRRVLLALYPSEIVGRESRSRQAS